MIQTILTIIMTPISLMFIVLAINNFIGAWGNFKTATQYGIGHLNVFFGSIFLLIGFLLFLIVISMII